MPHCPCCAIIISWVDEASGRHHPQLHASLALPEGRPHRPGGLPLRHRLPRRQPLRLPHRPHRRGRTRPDQTPHAQRPSRQVDTREQAANHRRRTGGTLHCRGGHTGVQGRAFRRSYFNFMNKYSFKPSGRPVVQFVPDLELAYVSQRYKEIHDFLHVLLLDEVTVHNELVVKWFEMVQLGLPAAALAVLVSPLLSDQMTLAQTARVCRQAKKCRFVMNVHFEAEFAKPLEQLRKELMG